ncbi:MAG: hypothetical protein ABI769_18105 [Pseudomonadota bacterium]
MNALEQQIVEARAAFDHAVGGRDSDAAYKLLRELQREEQLRFALARGWRCTSRHISLEQLKAGMWIRTRPSAHDPEIDHAEFFVDGPLQRPQIAAIRSHTYASGEKVDAFAHRHGLRVEVLPFSSYIPNRTVAVVYTRKK